MIDETQSEMNKKQHGVYYTPKNLATIIANSVVNKKDVTVFDPSFGNGALLKAAGERLLTLGEKNPENSLYGVDIDPFALANLSNSNEFDFRLENFMIGNFLSLRPPILEKSHFDIIIGNPPFTRHHDINSSEKNIAKQAMERIGIDVSGYSGYWVYFLIHSLLFLKDGGNLSILVPYSLLDAFYSRRIQNLIELYFRSTTLHILKPGYFIDTQEHVLLLDAREFQGLESRKRGDFQLVLNGLDGSRGAKKASSAQEWNIESVLLSSKTRKLLAKLNEHPNVSKIGNFAEIKIGVVTGGNKYFILNSSDIKKLEIDKEFLQSIITKSSMLKGLYLRKSNLIEFQKDNDPVFLLKIGSDSNLPASLDRYLRNKESIPVQGRYKCRIRKPWYSITIGAIPDAFLHYMTIDTPRLVLNKADVTSTNTIHRIYWRRRISQKKEQVVAMASLTSLSNLHAEIIGSRLSAGLLKIEPSKGASLMLPITRDPINDSDWESVHNHLRKNEIGDAIDLADEVILKNGLELSNNEIKLLNRGYMRMKRYRIERHL